MATIAAAGIVALLCFAAWRDLLTRTIPDIVSIAIVVLGIAIRAPIGWSALLTSCFVAVALFVLLTPFHSRGVVGGADMKLLSALAIGLSPLGAYRLIAFVAIAGAILALAYLGLGRWFSKSASVQGYAPVQVIKRPRRLSRRFVEVEVWRIRSRAQLPYGVAIAAGAALVLFAQTGV